MILFFFLSAAPCCAQSVAGVSFSPEMEINGTAATLRGKALLRWMMVVKAYAGAFYLKKGAASADALSDVERALVLHYFHAIPAGDLAAATAEMIRKNVGPDRFSAISSKIDQINALYRDVEPGDRYRATYRPGAGTTLSLNGTPLGTVSGYEFSRAYFSIWIGESPIDKEFRNKLLGTP